MMKQHSIILLLIVIILGITIYLVNKGKGNENYRRGCDCKLCWGKDNCPNCGCPDVACEDECL